MGIPSGDIQGPLWDCGVVLLLLLLLAIFLYMGSFWRFYDYSRMSLSNLYVIYLFLIFFDLKKKNQPQSLEFEKKLTTRNVRVDLALTMRIYGYCRFMFYN